MAKSDGDKQMLQALFEKALEGDRKAIKDLIDQLAKHRVAVLGKLRGLGKRVNNATAEDLFQEGIIELMRRLEAGQLNNLDEEERKDVLKYFQVLCDGKLRDVVRARKSPALKRRMPEIPEEFADPNAKIPGQPRHTEDLARINKAAAELEPERAAILKMHREGATYEEIARATGKSEVALRDLIRRTKLDLQKKIALMSKTAALHYEKSLKRLKRSEIEAAVAKLPPINKDAFMFVHMEGHTVEDLAKRLGDDDTHRAQGRLDDAYRLLNERLNDIFPEAYEQAE